SPGIKRAWLVFHPDGRQLAVSDEPEGAVRLLDLETSKFIRTLPHPKSVKWIAWRPDGQLLACACSDFQVYVWDVASPNKPLAVLKGHQNDVIDVTFSASGELLASTSWDQTIRLWDPLTGKELVRAPNPYYGCLRFSPNDRFLPVANLGGGKVGL